MMETSPDNKLATDRRFTVENAWQETLPKDTEQAHDDLASPQQVKESSKIFGNQVQDFYDPAQTKESPEAKNSQEASEGKPTENPLQNPNFLPLRGMVFLVITTIVLLWKSAGSPSTAAACVNDLVSSNLGPMNKALTSNQTNTMAALQVSSALLLDLVYIITAVYWAVNAKTCRLLLSMGLLFGFKNLMLLCFKMGIPQDYSWEDPNFPSLMMAYGKTNDFFYSGTTGFLMLCALEWSYYGFRKASMMIHGINAYISIVMLICRVHYTIDIVFGVLIAHYIFLNVDKRCGSVDAVLTKVWASFCTYLENRKRNVKTDMIQSDRLVFVPPKKTTVKAYEIEF